MDNPTRDFQGSPVNDSNSGEAPPNRRTEAAVDESGSDADEPQIKDSDSGAAPPDRPAGDGAGQDQDPLIEFLRRLIKERNITKTAKLLGVDRKTIWRALDAGRLTPRLRDALEREQKAIEKEEAGDDRLELRVAGLQRRLQDVEEQLASGLSGLREELAGVSDEVRTLNWTRPGGAGTEAATASTIRSPHRTYPQVVTVEALPNDGQILGDAMPLIAEWRYQRARFKAHWPSVEGLEAEVRMLELELQLIEERRLTLAPGQLPWEWDQRRREARRREQRLGNARSKLRRARRRRVVATALTFGLWKHR